MEVGEISGRRDSKGGGRGKAVRKSRKGSGYVIKETRVRPSNTMHDTGPIGR